MSKSSIICLNIKKGSERKIRLLIVQYFVHYLLRKPHLNNVFKVDLFECFKKKNHITYTSD